MPEYPTLYRHLKLAGPLLFVIFLTAGCDRLNQVLPFELPSSESTPIAQATEAAVPTASPPQPTSTPTAETTTLTLWTTEALGPVGQTPGSHRLSAQIAAFEAANLGITVNVVLKKPYGKGGMLDYLKTTAAAVPAELPDVAILDIRELRTAIQRDLIQSLDGRITPQVAQDLVAPARQAAQVDGTWYGLPFEADLQHLIYNKALVPTAPVTWTNILSGTTEYLFPAGGQAATTGPGDLANDAFIIQYLGTGAGLVADSGQLILDEGAVAAVLQFYADGLKAGVIPKDAIQYNTIDDTWPLYLSEEVGLANTTAHKYLEGREGFQKSSFAPIPTRDGTVVSVFRGWAYVLAAQESERQDLAWSLIEWLTNSERMGEWALAANYLPTRLSAFPDESGDEYVSFLADLLQNSRVRPTGAGQDEVARALQRAVQSIFEGTATPAEAAAQAAASLP